jgi:hypothetical protein
MEILWTPPTGGFGPEMLDEESPFLIGDEEMFLDESMPSFLAGSMTEEGETPPPAWTSAASIPYATPPYPWVTPPPPGKPTPPPPPAVAKKPAKKAPPKIKPTRASLLLQKKKTEAAAPPPPPPATAKKPVARKSSSKIVKRPSKPKAEEPPPPPPPQEEAPPKKKVVKKPSKGKVKKPTKKADESKVVALAQLEGTTGTEPHREFPPDGSISILCEFLVEVVCCRRRRLCGPVQQDDGRDSTTIPDRYGQICPNDSKRRNRRG